MEKFTHKVRDDGPVKQRETEIGTHPAESSRAQNQTLLHKVN